MEMEETDFLSPLLSLNVTDRRLAEREMHVVPLRRRAQCSSSIFHLISDNAIVRM